jgi:hypothetical protein
MSYIPKNAKWYLADIMLEIQVQDEDTNIVHVNLTLIRANSPEEAYHLAIQVGKQSEIIYQNTDGKTVTMTFRGLRDLNVIHENLEHGSEIIFEELVDQSEEHISRLVRSKQDLAVFRPRKND